MQLGALTRDARLDAIETLIGTAPIMELRTGSPPANCAAAPTGSLLSRDALPSDWLAAAASGSKAKAGTWTLTGLAGIATSTIGYFRIIKAGSPDVCEMQGTVGLTGSPTVDMTVDNTSLAAAQVVTVTSFNLTDGNA